MNMTGGQPGFCSSSQKKAAYGPRLLREVAALLDGRDMVGLTEINPFWYEWLTTQPSFAAGKLRGFHDGHDCAIVYDAQKLEPVSDVTVDRTFLESEIPDGASHARYSWRQYMAVEFRHLASPQETFTAACTHSIRGSIKKGHRITTMTGDADIAARKMSTVATRALQKVIHNHHMPSLAAGHENHLAIVMGDWNITAANMLESVSVATDQTHASKIGATIL